ncbi:MAG: Ig-like domain-containing protein, partial [Prevotella sp.]|nr:Ig-like domain-containing protein [Prevotella sp.]
MKHKIRLFLVLAALIAGSAGTVQAGTSDLAIAIVNQVAPTDATIRTYVSDAVPTETTLGTAATTIELGKYLVIEVTPTDGNWTYSDLFKIEKGVGIGGAESRPRRANGDMNLGESPTALSTNKADGSGIYYYQIPTSWTDATAVFIHGSVIDKINLSTATASTDGKTFTTVDRTDGWKATITLDEVNFTYNKSAQGPAISSISVTNGTKTMSTVADHVSISGNSQTNASDSYNATLTAVATGCLTGSVTAHFEIAKAPTEISLNTPPGGGEVGQMYIDDDFTIVATLTPAEAGSLTYTLDKESVVTVDANGIIKAVGEGEVTITVSFTGNDNYAAATSKTMKIKVSKVPTEITFEAPNPNSEGVGQLSVLDEVAIGATLTPAAAGSLTYSYNPTNGSVVTIDNGIIKAIGAGTATITASYAGNNKYAASSKTINVSVTKADASLAFDAVTKTFGDPAFTPSPSTKTSDGAITFTSGNTNVITVGSDGKLNIVAASATPVTITASQAASNSYNATTAEFTVTVNPKTVTVSGITASG